MSDESKEEITEKKEIQKAIELKDGLVQTKDLTEEARVAQMMLSSRALPTHFENVQQVIMAMQFLKSHKINPMIGLRQTMIVNGSISVWGNLPLAIVQNSGQLESIKEFIIDKDYKEICFDNKNLNAELYAGVCIIKRLGKSEVTKTFTVDEAKKAGLWGVKVWAKYPQRMIQMRTRSLALKDEFSDIIEGLSIREYDFDGVESKNTNVALELNEAFIDEDKEQEVTSFN